jgi:hypothetical protein
MDARCGVDCRQGKVSLSQEIVSRHEILVVHLKSNPWFFGFYRGDDILGGEYEGLIPHWGECLVLDGRAGLVRGDLEEAIWVAEAIAVGCTEVLGREEGDK